MAVVRELIAKFGIRTDPKGLNKANQQISTLARSAVALGGVFLTGIAARGFGRLLEFGSDATENLNVIEAAFGRLTPTILDWASQTADAVGRSEFMLREFAASTGAMVGPMLGSQKAAADMSTQIATLAVDLGSFFNATDIEALTALKAGLIGSSEPLRRFGVVMSTATLDAFALQKGLGKTTKQMTEGEKVALRFRFIMEQTRKAQGDAARTSAAYANMTKRLSGKLRDISTRLSQLFLPTAEKVVAVLIDVTKQVNSWFKANAEIIQSVAKLLALRIGQSLARFARFFGRLADATRKFVKELTPLQKQLLTISAIAVGLAAVLLLPGGSLLLLLALVGLIIDDFEVWRKGGKSLIGDLLGPFDKFEKKIEALRERFSGVIDVVKFLSDRTQEIMFSLAQFVIDIFDKGPIEAVLNLGRNLKEVGDKMFGWLVAPAQEAADFLEKLFQDLWDFISKGFTNLFESNVKAVKDIGRLIGGIFGGGEVGTIARAGAAGGIAVPGPTARPRGGASIINAPTNRIEVNVKAGPGMNEAALADLTARKIDQALVRERRAAMQAVTPVLP